MWSVHITADCWTALAKLSHLLTYLGSVTSHLIQVNALQLNSSQTGEELTCGTINLLNLVTHLHELRKVGTLVQLTGVDKPAAVPAYVCRLHVVAVRLAARVSDRKRVSTTSPRGCWPTVCSWTLARPTCSGVQQLVVVISCPRQLLESGPTSSTRRSQSERSWNLLRRRPQHAMPRSENRCQLLCHSSSAAQHSTFGADARLPSTRRRSHPVLTGLQQCRTIHRQPAHTWLKTVASCFAVLRQLCSIWCLVPTSIYQMLVVALVLSRLDYGNAVLVGLPGYLYSRLQSVLNAAARSIAGLQRSDHITDTLASFHWLRAFCRQLKTFLFRQSYPSVFLSWLALLPCGPSSFLLRPR